MVPFKQIVFKIRMLLWHNNDGFVSLFSFLLRFLESLLYVWPNIGCVVSVEVYYLFCHDFLLINLHVVFWVITIAIWSDGIKVILIGFSSYDVDGLMHSNFRMQFAVLFLVASKYPIIADLLKFNLYWLHLTLLESLSFLKVMDFRKLSLLIVESGIEVLLTCGTQESSKGWFSHAWKSNRY